MRPVRSSAGFTTIELMVVLVIAGLSLAAAIPAFQSFLRSNQVNDAASQLSGRLRLARQSAVAQGIPRIVTFDLEGGTYSIVRDANADGVVQDGETVEGTFTLPHGITMESAEGEGFGGDQVVFNPNGSASATGALVLANEAGYSTQLTVLAPTGQVRVN
jgi:type II secretion system protein H